MYKGSNEEVYGFCTLIHLLIPSLTIVEHYRPFVKSRTNVKYTILLKFKSSKLLETNK